MLRQLRALCALPGSRCACAHMRRRHRGRMAACALCDCEGFLRWGRAGDCGVCGD
jgi:hypothetical protein